MGMDDKKLLAPEALVLVVDDNQMNLVVFESLLNQTQAGMDMAESGDEALKLAYTKKYDLIFLDHMMPEKDGLETLHEMRAQEHHLNLNTPVICLTANADPGAREAYMEAGFDDYLTKPLDFVKLKDMLWEYLPKDKIRIEEDSARKDIEEEKRSTKLAALHETHLVDVHRGLENSGSEIAYFSLLKIFYESLEGKAKEIEMFYEAGDIKGYTIKTHALKSSARIIGAISLGEEAQKLEDAGRQGNLEYIRKNHEKLLEDYRQYQKILAEVLEVDKEQWESKMPVADVALMESVYEGLLEAAEEMDCDKMDGIFAEMDEYVIPEEEEKKFGLLKEKARQFDYEGMIEVLT